MPAAFDDTLTNGLVSTDIASEDSGRDSPAVLFTLIVTTIEFLTREIVGPG